MKVISHMFLKAVSEMGFQNCFGQWPYHLNHAPLNSHHTYTYPSKGEHSESSGIFTLKPILLLFIFTQLAFFPANETHQGSK